VKMSSRALKSAAAGLVVALPLVAGVAPTMAAAAPAPQATVTAVTAQLSSPAAKLRLDLSELMGAHAWLLLMAMEQGYSGAPQYTDTVTALNTNSDQLTQAWASVYGLNAGATFSRTWNARIGDFTNYVVMAKEGDKAGQQKALAALRVDTAAWARFVEGLNPKFSKATLNAGLQTDITGLITALDDYQAANYQGAATGMIAAYDNMFDMADTLSSGIAAQNPKTFAGNPNAAGVNLNVALDELLAAHAFLALNAMDQGYAGSQDFQATDVALNTNTEELGAAFGSIYGSKAQSEFGALWTEHIGYFVNLVTAWKTNNTSLRIQALSDLQTYKNQFAAFLASANPNVDPLFVEDDLQMHIHMLAGTFDAYREGEYAKAAVGEVYAYDHMFGTGSYLAQAIAEQFPSKFGA
jgi:hypothetical protein